MTNDVTHRDICRSTSVQYPSDVTCHIATSCKNKLKPNLRMQKNRIGITQNYAGWWPAFVMKCIVWGSLVAPLCASLHGPPAGYAKLWVAHAPRMPGTVSSPSRVSDPNMRVTQMPWCMPGSLTSGFPWTWWRGKRSWHSRRMPNQ